MKNNFEVIIWLIESKAPVIKAEQLNITTLLSFLLLVIVISVTSPNSPWQPSPKWCSFFSMLLLPEVRIVPRSGSASQRTHSGFYFWLEGPSVRVQSIEQLPVIKGDPLRSGEMLGVSVLNRFCDSFPASLQNFQTFMSHANFHKSHKSFQQIENPPAAVRRGAVRRGGAGCCWILDTDNKLITDKSDA